MPLRRSENSGFILLRLDYKSSRLKKVAIFPVFFFFHPFTLLPRILPLNRALKPQRGKRSSFLNSRGRCLELDMAGKTVVLVFIDNLGPYPVLLALLKWKCDMSGAS